jgi:hypothetical protein
MCICRSRYAYFDARDIHKAHFIKFTHLLHQRYSNRYSSMGRYMRDHACHAQV